jgi:hypothetical protein
MIVFINLLALFIGDQLCMLPQDQCPIIVSIDFEGGRDSSGERVTTEAGFPFLDPRLLINSTDMVRDAMRHTNSHHFLFRGRVNTHPDPVVEFNMRINRYRRPRWGFAFGPHPENSQMITTGDGQQRLSADTEVIHFETLGDRLRSLVVAAGAMLGDVEMAAPRLYVAIKPYFKAQLFRSEPQKRQKKVSPTFFCSMCVSQANASSGPR